MKRELSIKDELRAIQSGELTCSRRNWLHVPCVLPETA